MIINRVQSFHSFYSFHSFHGFHRFYTKISYADLAIVPNSFYGNACSDIRNHQISTFLSVRLDENNNTTQVMQLIIIRMMVAIVKRKMDMDILTVQFGLFLSFSQWVTDGRLCICCCVVWVAIGSGWFSDLM